MNRRPHDGETGPIGHARFRMPVPAREAAPGERLRLVDPTGMAVAWLDCGEDLVIRAFHVRNGEEPWQEIAHDLVLAIPGADGAGRWILVERDPTMAHLCWQGDAPVEIRAEVADRRMTIATDTGAILVVDPDGATP